MSNLDEHCSSQRNSSRKESSSKIKRHTRKQQSKSHSKNCTGGSRTLECSKDHSGAKALELTGDGSSTSTHSSSGDSTQHKFLTQPSSQNMDGKDTKTFSETGHLSTSESNPDIDRTSLCDPTMSMVCLSDFELFAKEHLPKTTWDYYAAGADECCTRDDNLVAYKRIRLRPRMLRDVSVTDTRTTIQGMEINFPIGIAPTAFHCLAWHDGEMSTARAAEAMNTCYIASTYSTCSVEEISTAAPNGLQWFQLYVYRNRKLSEQLVQRVEAQGYKAVVLTVDVPYTGKRRNDIRNNFKLPPHLKVKNFDGIFEDFNGAEVYGGAVNSLDPSISWKDIYWLQSLTRLPIIIKGILTKEDAELAVEHGVQGIIVSNHGGRQLDGGPASIDALSEIVETVQGRVEVYLDGGIRTGSDVLKALALGAKCVFIGRPVVWGLAYKGEEGVREILQILNDEFRLSMALAGCRNVSEINRNLIQFSKL
uniref:(S)-2-hydroxy-acid oxidase n=3 Tax=Callorhinchus milii TaxID=7868 RepID=A0A4W3H0M8_CALMI|eukprot:gi/632956649/ref/XP_007894062.1/ PREDICTED: hydroxyacid oxidase 2 isoform X3 [Callorhinchus milii]